MASAFVPPTADDRSDAILWAGTLGNAGFEERLRAAVAAGFTGMSVFPWDCRPPGERRSRAAERCEQAESHGIRLVSLDPLTTWLPGITESGRPTPDWSKNPGRAQFVELFNSYSVAECLDMACEIGANVITAMEPYGRHVETEPTAAAFARVCDLAAGLGLRIQLEFMPFSGIPDLSSAWEIVQRAGTVNGGLVLDAWHFFQSSPDLELLRSLPPSSIFSVQLSDGSGPETDLWQAANERLLPGDGTFDLVGLLGVIRDRHAAALVGPEVVSGELSRLEPIEAAHRAAYATARILHTARQVERQVEQEGRSLR